MFVNRFVLLLAVANGSGAVNAEADARAVVSPQGETTLVERLTETQNKLAVCDYRLKKECAADVAATAAREAASKVAACEARGSDCQAELDRVKQSLAAALAQAPEAPEPSSPRIVAELRAQVSSLEEAVKDLKEKLKRRDAETVETAKETAKVAQGFKKKIKSLKAKIEDLSVPKWVLDARSAMLGAVLGGFLVFVAFSLKPRGATPQPAPASVPATAEGIRKHTKQLDAVNDAEVDLSVTKSVAAHIVDKKAAHSKSRIDDAYGRPAAAPAGTGLKLEVLVTNITRPADLTQGSGLQVMSAGNGRITLMKQQ